MGARPPGEPVAVIDIGSNSARVVAYVRDDAGHLRILAGTRAALRLVADVDDGQRLSKAAIDRAIDALRDFRAVALGSGARRIHAVATAAVRDASNGAELLERIRRELDLTVRIADGAAEATLGFLGGLHGLPVEHGLFFDMGGGSIQLARFRDRRLLAGWSLPLGALRLSQAFLVSDPPKAREARALREHVRESLGEAGIVPLGPDEELVGTGGTVRNVAKVDRRRRRYPITRVHGYLLKASRVRDIASLLATRSLRKRERVPGLSDERADSIVGGALAIDALTDAVGATRIMVSGMGVREGLLYSLVSDALPPVAQVAEASVASLTSRFWGHRPEVARRRSALALRLLDAIWPEAGAEIREALGLGALVVDVGRSVDFFDRHHHAADIVLETEMNGFTHRQVALVSAIVRVAGDERSDARRYEPLLNEADWEAVRRAAVLLVLADDIEERCPPQGSVEVDCSVRGRRVHLSVPGLLGWRPRAVGPRFERLFGRPLVVSAGG